MSGLLLRDGDFVACVYRGLVDDFAADAVSSIAAKITKTARKKFSKMILKVFDSEISAWDYFCYAMHAGDARSQDKFISDYLRVTLMKKLERMNATELNLMAISTLPIEEIDERSELRTEAVFERIHFEILQLAAAHGETLPRPATSVARPFAQAVRPMLSDRSSTNGASPI